MDGYYFFKIQLDYLTYAQGMLYLIVNNPTEVKP